MGSTWRGVFCINSSKGSAIWLTGADTAREIKCFVAALPLQKSVTKHFISLTAVRCVPELLPLPDPLMTSGILPETSHNIPGISYKKIPVI